jgi:transcription elongation factor Elf1
MTQTKRMLCPICGAANDVEISAVGCYVLCKNCPHRFYVPVPKLGEEMGDEPQPVPNAIPDYKAWDARQTNQDKSIEMLAVSLRWQQTMMLVLLASQAITALIVALLYFRG